jgi:hypothetical protein
MMIEKESYIMNEYSTFNAGVADALSDDEWFPSHLTIDYLVNHLRVMIGASDAYIAGYLSVVFAE